MSRIRRKQNFTRSKRSIRSRYMMMAGIIMGLTLVASFYIYQRVWVRNLVGEITAIEKQNEKAREHLADVKAKWISVSSIASIEDEIDSQKLALRPTRLQQNLVWMVPSEAGTDRYAGLVNAFEKLAKRLPLIEANEAEAQQLFVEE